MAAWFNSVVLIIFMVLVMLWWHLFFTPRSYNQPILQITLPGKI